VQILKKSELFEQYVIKEDILGGQNPLFRSQIFSKIQTMPKQHKTAM
jgi:hypothetical protein